MMELNNFLVRLMGGGAVIAVSWIFEQFAWFQQISPNLKQWLMFVLSALVGVGALYVTTSVPKEVLDAIAPYFAIIASVFGMIFLNQIAHTLNPKRKC